MSSSGNAGLQLSMSLLLLIAPCTGGVVVVPAAVRAGPRARPVAARVRLERPQKIVRLSSKGARAILDLARRRIDGISGFLPNGIAVAPNGDIFTDTFVGNGFANKTALIEVRPGGHIQVLWKA